MRSRRPTSSLDASSDFPEAESRSKKVPVVSVQPSSDFLRTLKERGFIHQCSDMEGLDAKAKSGDLVAYSGYDCTAPSLHIGHLIPIMLMRWLQKTGGKPIVLVGGGTTRVGDPSGKDESRKILSLEDIEHNKTEMQKGFASFLTFGEGKTDAVMVDNADWLGGLKYLDFLRDVGRYFSVNRMLTMDSVKLRLERDQELSFLEFNYMCCQAYDFVELSRRFGVSLQMGGSDQWGNIITGLDLGRRMGTPQLYALTVPLLTTSSGAKMGKTAKGAVWLNDAMLPVFEYWQFWRNCDDADVGKLLRLFTELPIDETARLEALGGVEINDAKKVLATEATALLHGRAAAEAAAETARRTFVEGTIAQDLPSVALDKAELAAGLGVLAAFQKVGLVTSTGEARRQVKAGGLKVNDAPVTDERAVLHEGDLRDGAIKLSFGRKKHVLLKVE